MADKLLVSRSVRAAQEFLDAFELDASEWVLAAYSNIPGGGYTKAVICGLGSWHSYDIAPWVKNHMSNSDRPGALTILT